TLYLTTGGTYDLSSKTVSGRFHLYAASNSGTTLIGNDANGQCLYASSSGDDTLVAGDGAVSYLYGGGGDNVFVSGSGNQDIYGDGGYDSYEFGGSFGNDRIFNGGTSASGEVAFTSGIDCQQLWFKQVGNDLEIDLLGTDNTVSIDGWYLSAGSQTQSISADGIELDSQLSQLVSAMATYSANNPGFDPTTAAAMPTDSSLQATIAAAWHS
ncbi:MAG: hypothetical protein PHW76_03300, partial [Alphaproteobacteria bacterium]|nr:hypothetical protein [Alphaproteobacteria bacterium]